MGTISVHPITQRKFNWKVALFLLGLILIAALLKIPAVIYLVDAADSPGDWLDISLMTLLQEGLILAAVPALIGLALATRLGLGLPIVDAWLNRQPIRAQVGRMLKIACIASVITATCILVAVFLLKPLLMADLQSHGFTNADMAATPVAPIWTEFLASFSAGVLEETGFRLGLMTLLVWLGGLVWKDANRHPHPIIFWLANILIALAFGGAHISSILMLGLPLTTVIVLYAILGNGLAALVFGWLYWKRGLETAMLTHFFVDIITHVLLPLVLMFFKK